VKEGRGDSDAAERAAREHIANGYKIRLTMMSEPE
jgi:DNA-binding FadR family transcriptional regulator